MLFKMAVLRNSLLFNVLLWTSLFEFTHELYQTHPDIGLKMEEIIKKYNYPFEKYTVQTEDGYFLELHRIPNTKFNKGKKNFPSVLLFSGILGDSSTWVMLGPKKGLGFILSDHGYDVWMGNNRGTTLCKKHGFLDPKKDKKTFWNFSFHELGYYDIPITIDYILNITKQEQLVYIGFSQGTSSFFAMLSEKPNYNNKIKFAIALAPVASLKNSLSAALHFLMQNIKTFKELMESHDIYEILPYSKYTTRFIIEHCSPNSSNHNLCAMIVCNTLGSTMKQIDKSTLHLILSNSAGASLKEALHLLQFNKGIFHKYDYGKNKNLKKYGQEKPPIYNLSNVNVPMALIYGSADILASQKDVELLAPKLLNIVGMKIIPKFNHIDLVFGIDAPVLVFPNILNLLKMYS